VFRPFRIENAQRQRYLLLIYAHEVGVNEKRCNNRWISTDEDLKWDNPPAFLVADCLSIHLSVTLP